MLFSHISDTHLGLQQYGLEEREQDIYDSFNQAIDISIKDNTEFLTKMQLANGLLQKKLRVQEQTLAKI